MGGDSLLIPHWKAQNSKIANFWARVKNGGVLEMAWHARFADGVCFWNFNLKNGKMGGDSLVLPHFTLAQKLAILVFWAFQWGIRGLSPPIFPTSRLKIQKRISSAKRACYAISKTPPFFTLAQIGPNWRPVLDFCGGLSKKAPCPFKCWIYVRDNLW